MLENRFYKVTPNHGCTFITADFYNPVTDEEKYEVVRDYDYEDCRRDNDELYYMEVDKDVARIWRHKHGIIDKGDRAEVVKGRTLPKGYCGTVVKKYDVKDRFNRWVATYIRFEDGNKINVENCILIKE